MKIEIDIPDHKIQTLFEAVESEACGIVYTSGIEGTEKEIIAIDAIKNLYIEVYLYLKKGGCKSY